MFGSQYALIEDAWSMKASPRIHNPYKDAAAFRPAAALTNDAPAPRLAPSEIRQTLSDAYRRGGLAGVRPFLDPAIVRDLQTRRPRPPRGPLAFVDGFDGFDVDALMHVALGLCVILLLIDL